jgi:hypothetical protein
LARLSTGYYQSQKIWLGVQTQREFLDRSPQTASFYPLAEAADLLPADDHLLIVGDARGLYYPRPYWTNSVFDDPELVTLTQKSKDAEGIGEGLQRLGVEDLVVSGEEGRRLSQLYAHAYPLTPQEWNRLDDFIQRGTDLVYVDGANGIYRIHPLKPALKPRIPDLLLLFQPTPVRP